MWMGQEGQGAYVDEQGGWHIRSISLALRCMWIGEEGGGVGGRSGWQGVKGGGGARGVIWMSKEGSA